ncbi:MAG: translational GTPase TypA [Planctomycetes bacterium]|nr:translational GTPase TypA [Planctomycetota bacterium]
MPNSKKQIRNIAIVAHVDHGKTTLVDTMFQFAGTFRKNQQVQERAMDSDAQERERGITILAKNTAIDYHGYRINIVDTPGHADFGGQVERTLRMADAVLLLVDAAEGPMPQTRFVLRKAFENGLRALVMINKIDRPDARVNEVLDEVFELFIELGAHDDQLDFPVVYGSGRDGYAMADMKDEKSDLKPLFDMLLKHVPAPVQDDAGALQFQAATLDHDDFLGRIAIGRVKRGVLRNGARVAVCHPDRSKATFLPIKGLFRYEGLNRVATEEVHCGDIAVVAGIEDLMIGDTLCPVEQQDPLPAIVMDEPTIAMEFFVSNSPFAGQEGQFVTSRQILGRLEKAAQRDVALVLMPPDASIAGEGYELKGRGVMHLGVLIENMRREGYEFSVGKPRVVLKKIDGKTHEPYERASIDVPTVHAGKIIEYFGRRRGEMTHMEPFENSSRIEFLIPSRGLIGARTALMTLSQGMAILSHVFECWRPDGGPLPMRQNGVLIADRTGDSIPYGMFGLLDRGTFFIEPGTPVYEGMIIGENNKDNDLGVNVCREKKLTNIRSAGKDDNVKLPPPHVMSLEESLEYLEDDELLEVTPKTLRLRKRVLSEMERKKQTRKDNKAARV